MIGKKMERLTNFIGFRCVIVKYEHQMPMLLSDKQK